MGGLTTLGTTLIVLGHLSKRKLGTIPPTSCKIDLARTLGDDGIKEDHSRRHPEENCRGTAQRAQR